MQKIMQDPIRELIDRIEREQGAGVPDVDPDGPRENAKIVVMLESPGKNGAKTNAVLSPWKNWSPQDNTARNQRTLLPLAGLTKEKANQLCVWWNAVPWALYAADGGDRKPTPAEVRAAIPYLLEFLEIVSPRAVVAMGRPAQDACRQADVSFLPVRHPSRFAHATKEQDFLAPLRRALELAEQGER